MGQANREAFNYNNSLQRQDWPDRAQVLVCLGKRINFGTLKAAFYNMFSKRKPNTCAFCPYFKLIDGGGTASCKKVISGEIKFEEWETLLKELSEGKSSFCGAAGEIA